MDLVDGKLYVHWEDIDLICHDLADKISAEPYLFVGIITVAKGGLVPTGIITNHMKNKLPIDILYLQSRQGETQASSVSVYTSCGFNHHDRLLVIDDIIDSGMTMKFIKFHYPNAIFASVFVREKTKSFAEYFGRIAPDNTWIVFPWELNNVEARN